MTCDSYMCGCAPPTPKSQHNHSLNCFLNTLSKFELYKVHYDGKVKEIHEGMGSS